jgi:predicted MFS family arabinose efflux permease
MIVAALSVRLIDEWWSYLPGGIIEDLRSDLGVSYSQAGSLIALAMLSGLIGGPLGALADVADRRLVAVAGSAVQTLGLVLFAAGHSFWILATGVLLLGAAADLVIRPLEAALAESTPEPALERALGRQHLLSFVGDFIGPVLLTIGAVTWIGWRGAFWVTAIALAAYTVFLSTLSFPSRAAESTDDPSSASLRDLLRRRDVLRLVALDILLFPLDEPIAAFAVAAIAINRSSIAQSIALGYVVGGIAASAVVDRRGLEGVARRYGGPALVVGSIGVAGAIASTEIGPVNATFAGLAAVLAMLCVGVGMGFTWATVHHQQLTVVPGRSASVASIVGTLGSVGAVWPSLAGVVSDKVSISAALGVFVLAAVVVALMTSPRNRLLSVQPAVSSSSDAGA